MFRRKRLTLQHKVRTATLLLKAGWVGVIYAALDEAVSFVSLTSPVSLSERLSARVAP